MKDIGKTFIERDALGRETRITDLKGRAVSYSYDRLGNRTSVSYAKLRYAKKYGLEEYLPDKPLPSEYTGEE